jgi:hypothetical protein
MPVSEEDSYQVAVCNLGGGALCSRKANTRECVRVVDPTLAAMKIGHCTLFRECDGYTDSSHVVRLLYTYIFLNPRDDCA